MQSALLYLPYLPSIAWFSDFLRYEEVWIEREENFVKSSYRNRCEIAGANGKQTLSIPIIGGRDHHQLYKDVKIAYQNDWQRIHWQSIRSAYGSAPYFEHYAGKFEPFYQKRFDFLFDYNLEILNAILPLLRARRDAISCVSHDTDLGHNKDAIFCVSTTYEKEPVGKVDLRMGYGRDAMPCVSKHIDLGHKGDAKYCVSTGQRYYQVFEERNGFIPNLSMIDLLMNEGPEAIKYLEMR